MKAQDVIPGLLMIEDMSGYDIKKAFEQRFSYFFDASYGSIYPILKKMEDGGHIQKTVIVQEGKPNRNLYSITESGKELFYNYLQSPIEPDVIRSDFNMRMYFGSFADYDTQVAWIEQRIERAQQTVQELHAILEECGQLMNTTQIVCVELGISHYQGIRDTLVAGLKKLADTKR